MKINYIYFFGSRFVSLWEKNIQYWEGLAVSLWIVTPLLAEKKTKCGKADEKAKTPFGV
ncbi:MAG TPA: hypothetical protein PKM63_16445 [Panacibacter sp.]|nr:hypothetical protein [Panacibacter sp.]HNP45883.1 hypothetical protein [Panacibacter sp.]